MPVLAWKLRINVVGPDEMTTFASLTRPVVRKLIADTFGADGTDMLDALMMSTKQGQTDF